MKHLNTLKTFTAGKKIVGYGAGQALLATLTGSRLPMSYVVDDDLRSHGKHINGLPVYPPDKLLGEDKNGTFIVIFAYLAKTILDISERLNRMGYIYGEHYVDCSVFHHRSVGSKLKKALRISPNDEAFFRTRMLSLYGGIESVSCIAGTWLFLELLKNISGGIRGDIAECGVFAGGNAFISLLNAPELSSKRYHLLDTFEGFPELSNNDPASRRGDYRDVNFTFIRDIFSNFANVRIHKGLFAGTFDEIASRRFSMVYVDCDLYESTRQCCDFFYSRISPGGVMLFHDYWVPEPGSSGPEGVFTGVNKAVNEFFQDKPEKLVVFPETTHALIVKKGAGSISPAKKR